MSGGCAEFVHDHGPAQAADAPVRHAHLRRVLLAVVLDRDLDGLAVAREPRLGHGTVEVLGQQAQLAALGVRHGQPIGDVGVVLELRAPHQQAEERAVRAPLQVLAVGRVGGQQQPGRRPRRGADHIDLVAGDLRGRPDLVAHECEELAVR